MDFMDEALSQIAASETASGPTIDPELAQQYTALAGPAPAGEISGEVAGVGPATASFSAPVEAEGEKGNFGGDVLELFGAKKAEGKSKGGADALEIADDAKETGETIGEAAKDAGREHLSEGMEKYLGPIGMALDTLKIAQGAKKADHNASQEEFEDGVSDMFDGGGGLVSDIPGGKEVGWVLQKVPAMAHFMDQSSKHLNLYGDGKGIVDRAGEAGQSVDEDLYGPHITNGPDGMHVNRSYEPTLMGALGAGAHAVWDGATYQARMLGKGVESAWNGVKSIFTGPTHQGTPLQDAARTLGAASE